MKMNASLLASALLSGSVAAGFAADVTGKVTLDGTPPKEAVIQPLMDDRVCGKMHDGTVTTRFYLVSADKGLGNVFVYVKTGLEGKKFDPVGEEPVIDQVGCLYEPYVSGLMAGQKFKVRNSDPVLHNVHATPKVNTEFNFAQTTKGQENEKVFDKPELKLRLKCDVHPWMFAFVHVVENPFYAVTDKDGNFKISGLPAGKYTLEFIHMKAGTTTKEIEVAGDTKADATLKAPAPQ
jgi:hypothetical protein